MRKTLLSLILLLSISPCFAQTCPTRPPGDNTNACASTAFVQGAVVATGVSSFNGRTGAVVPATNDYGFSQISGSVAASQLPSGVPANVLNSQAGDYTVLNTDCGKTVLMSTGNTAWKTLTVPAVAGFATTCTVKVINGDSTRAKKFAGLTGFTWLMPLQAIEIDIVNGVWAATSVPAQWIPAANLVFFVDDTNGNAANDCMAAGASNACTTASIMAFISANINNQNNIILQWANAVVGPFNAARYNGSGTITLDFNSNTITAGGSACACVIGIGSGGQTSPSVNGVWLIRRVTVVSSASGVFGLFCQTQVNCILQDGVTFGQMTAGSMYACYGLARCTCANNITVTATAGLHIFDVADYAISKCQNITVTVSNAYVGSGATVNAHGGGVNDVVGVTWTVTVSVTGQRFFADLLAVIDSGACASIPGTVAGTPTAGTLGASGGYCN